MLQATVNEDKKFEVTQQNDQWFLNNAIADWNVEWLPNGLLSVLYEGRSFTAMIENVDKKEKTISLRIDGQTYEVALQDKIDLLLSSMGMDLKAAQKAEPVKAPMPGMILKILVTEGQQIKKGDGLLILEAMKMENVIKASHDATIKSIKVSEKSAVEKGAVLMEMD